MSDEVKQLLHKHNYGIPIVLHSDKIVMHIPNRVIEPFMEAYEVTYTVGDGYMTYQAEGDDFPYRAICPTYAVRLLVFADIKRHAETLGFDTNLIEFFDGSDKIDETEFLARMWPKGVVYDNDTRKLEYLLKDLLIRAKNSVVPFHHDFYFEADQLGVLPGYLAIRSIFVFGEDDSDE